MENADDLVDFQINRRFVNADHRSAYLNAKALFDAEMERQKTECSRMMEEWDRLPNGPRMERIAALDRHFRARREPYVKLIGKILDLTSPFILLEPNASEPH